VSWASYETGSYDTYCATAVIVTNPTKNHMIAEVEWLDRQGVSQGRNAHILSPYRQKASTSFNNLAAINGLPFTWDASCPQGCDVSNPEFTGYALVTADDPQIMVSAFQFCRTGAGWGVTGVLAQTNIPAYPVGATMEFFQAGMPMNWTPPLVVPETPE
jgi:hypothetical protein